MEAESNKEKQERFMRSSEGKRGLPLLLWASAIPPCTIPPSAPSNAQHIQTLRLRLDPPTINTSMFLTLLWSLVVFFFLSSVSAHAEWRPIHYAEGAGGFVIYVDPTTVRRTGDLVKVLVLYDFKFVQAFKAKSYLSATWQQQFNCAEHRSRQLAYTYYSNNMGHGNAVLTGDDEGNKWSLVAPRSAAAILWSIVCDKDRQPT
ncbi:MAG TPA: surface-adhesin E family protein [Nitrospiraceae bacterium]|nr:surface-adhesin E family protein [Nitrospiraceae bacterium]